MNVRDIGASPVFLLDPDAHEQTYSDCPGQWAGDQVVPDAATPLP